MENKDHQQEFGQGGFSAHMVLLVCGLLFMINYMDRQVLSAVLEPMKLALGMTDSEAGIIQTGFLMCMAVFAYPTAVLVDRWSRRKTIGLMAMVWSVFTFATGLGKSFMGVLLPRLVVGVGETGFSAGGTAMISAAYPAKSRGKVMGIFYMSIPVGSALGVILGGWISNHFGDWRMPFFIFAIPGIILGICAFFLKDYKTHEEVDQSGEAMNVISQAKHLLKIPTLSISYVGLAMLTFMTFSVLTWLPAFLMRAHGINEKEAGMIAGMVSLMALVGSPLGGFLSDYWQKRNARGRMYLATVGAFIASACLLPAIFLEVQGVGLVLAMIWGVAAIAVMPVLVAVSQDVVSPGMKGSSVGLANLSIYLLGGGWAPWAMGIISDSMGGGVNGLKVALMVSCVGGLIGGILFFFASRTYPADQDRVKEMNVQAESS